MNYTKWTLYDEITLVIKNKLSKYSSYEYPQAYVVDPKDKKQLKNAINWGREKQYLYKDNMGVRESITDENGNLKYEILEPDVVTLKNSEFNLELLDSANGSCQGGKLSFWNCLISHGDIKCVVGINADILLEVLLQNDFKHGKCDATFSFARKAGNVGLLNNTMKEYTAALRDMQAKVDINKKKTTKWQKGHNYVTLTIDEMYFGKVYSLLATTNNPNYSYNYYDKNSRFLIEVASEKEDRINNILNRTSYIDVDTASKLRDLMINTIDSNIARLKREILPYKEKHNLSSYVLNGVRPLFDRQLYEKYVTQDKFPSRQQGDKVVTEDITFEQAFDEVIIYAQNECIKLIKEHDLINVERLITDLLIRTKSFADDFSDLTSNEIELIKLLCQKHKDTRTYTILNNVYDLVNINKGEK